mmetsp:Transcript_2285/g.2948  ORF Transcript_2285/g.2948 Transcript_2285/m.2948 type:complete len:155 (+) Transcript_2285:80-544(+)
MIKPATESTTDNNISKWEKEIKSLLSKRESVEALRVALVAIAAADTGTAATTTTPCEQRQRAKENNAKIIRNIIASFPSNGRNAKEAISQLSTIECDVLMKYLYRLLGNGSNSGGTMGASMGNNNGVLFRWHSELVEKAGIGSIVRVITDSDGF